MSLIKIAKTLREHWKKSIFALGVASYGVSYAIEKNEINELMHAYCKEAEKYGDLPQNIAAPIKKVVVILNPAANKRSAEKTFQQYCEPILHLSGLLVDVVKTDSEGHARRYVESLDKLPDAILVAGGDGTLSETITGLMRRVSNNTNTNDVSNKKCPIGVIPLGRTNSVAKKVHRLNSKPSNNLEEIRDLAESTMLIVRGNTKKKDVMKIQVLTDNTGDETIETNLDKVDEEQINREQLKPIYAMGSLQWGAFRDAQSYRDKYWYVGSLRDYASSLFHAFDNNLTWHCKTKLKYTPPCSGCNNCYIMNENETQFNNNNNLNRHLQLSTGRWWSRFIPKLSSRTGKIQAFNNNNLKEKEPDYSKITNENCTKEDLIEINPSELILSANNPATENPKLEVCTEGQIESSFDFISKSWKRIRHNEIETLNKEIEARTIELIPDKIFESSDDSKELYYSIDNEAYEVKPIKIILIPKAVELYSS